MAADNFTSRAARWSATHRRAVVLGWLAFVIAAFMLGSAIGMVQLRSMEAENGQSRLADETLAQQFPEQRAGEEVIVENPNGTLAGSGYRAAVSDLVTRLSSVPSVAAIRSPLAPENAGQISKSGRAVLVIFQITGDPDTAQNRVAPALAATAAVQRAYPGLFIGELGVASTNKAVNALVSDDFHKAEVTSVPVTLVILVIAFGALVAAGVPLLLGFTAVLAALGVTELLSHVLHVEQSITSVILCVGLAVGIDYSLFYVRRAREERAHGRDPQDALNVAAATSGRAILISGLTVMIAMTGMFLMGNQVFSSFGMGTVLVVAIALVGSLTVLPAVLSMLGDRVELGRVPGLQRLRARPGEPRFWAPIIRVVLHWPVVFGGAAVALLVALAIPAFSLHTVSAGMQGLPPNLPVMKAYERVQQAFPGGAEPETVVISAADVTSPRVSTGIAALEERALATGRMFEPITVDVSASHKAARVSIPLVGTGVDAASLNALALLRNSVIPETIGHVPGVVVHTTGAAGQTVDFNDTMKSHGPYVFAFVLGLAFLLLLLTFRSIVIPLTTIVLNLLSVGAAYGVLVVIFQQGHLQSLLDFASIGGIIAWLPLFLFVILFGLSMDYHVFILSRVREAHDRGMTTEDAVAHGINASAGVVTSAAIVMVAVFAIFATLGEIVFQMLGVGLAVAILLDATIVRAVLLPATMKLLGDWNWFLPSWLEWLPRLGVAPRSSPAIKHRPRARRLPRRSARPGRKHSILGKH
ncbi:MAG TPA: MMPL family transporter [Gaiellaceae bacterium]|nr:MMPL family transporter [Gaiellaceae bacterium]